MNKILHESFYNSILNERAEWIEDRIRELLGEKTYKFFVKYRNWKIIKYLIRLYKIEVQYHRSINDISLFTIIICQHGKEKYKKNFKIIYENN